MRFLISAFALVVALGLVGCDPLVNESRISSNDELLLLANSPENLFGDVRDHVVFLGPSPDWNSKQMADWESVLQIYAAHGFSKEILFDRDSWKNWDESKIAAFELAVQEVFVFQVEAAFMDHAEALPASRTLGGNSSSVVEANIEDIFQTYLISIPQSSGSEKLDQDSSLENQ